MRPSSVIVLLCLLGFALSVLPSLHAQAYGSQTRLTLSAIHYLQAEQKYINLPDGSYRSAQSVSQVRYGNRELLETMIERELIPSIKGYSLVMLRTGLGTRSYTFVVVHALAPTVRVPDDLLALDLGYGPRQGNYGYNAAGVITTLSYLNRFPANLRLENFEGGGLLVTQSSRKNLRHAGEIETVKLDAGAGTFTGQSSAGDGPGVCTAVLRLSGARAVPLAPFGENAPDGTADLIGGGSGGTVVVFPLPPGDLGPIMPIDVIGADDAELGADTSSRPR